MLNGPVPMKVKIQEILSAKYVKVVSREIQLKMYKTIK